MIYVYDSNLNKIGIVDRYNSLITSKRYRENGDCEIYMPASADALDLLRVGRYVSKTDDVVLYRINSIELATDAESGNFLTVKGIDAKSFIDQRIVLETTLGNGNAEAFALKLINDALGATASTARRLPFFSTAVTGLTETISEQVSYKNVGEKIREYCTRFGWGYRVEINGNTIQFSFYKGADRSAFVVFSPAYENISTSNYAEDKTNMGNFALIGGEGQGSDRIKETVGTATGADRYEIFVDAKDQSKSVTYKDVTSAYPGGVIITESGVNYYAVDGVKIAELESASPQPNDKCQLVDDIYRSQLDAKGNDALSQFGATKSFESTIFAAGTWTYGEDYFLGDIVKVENEYGISVNARIIEVVEVEDENGYSTEPKFEYLSEE